jgi:hypothetical protein
VNHRATKGAFTSRDRKSWQRLTVDWNVSLSRRLSRGLTERERERARLTAFKRIVDGKGEPPWARLNVVGWANPDAGEKGERKEGDASDLASLNRGGWLSTRLAIRLAQLGGELDLAKPAGKRKKRRKGKGKGARKRVAHLGAKRKRAAKRVRAKGRTAKRQASGVQKVGHHRRVARRKKAPGRPGRRR